ncbi:hypothetical protein ACIQ2D_20315 [Lysinibacillus sp. NPDC097287]|uniref:hypothetical protein n=1 Tax=Lysinibacillus sp. NPDC097287 TaxID=3364144 RepID=UPI0037FBAE8D
MESIIYYVVQVNDCFYKEKIGIPTFTSDEEQAFAFTDISDAHQLAAQISGAVLAREVSYKELEELSVQQRFEYEAFPKNERDRIESFCRELKIEV